MAFKKKAIAPDVREYLNQGRTLKDIEQSLGKSLFGYVQREDEYMNLYSQNLYSGVNRDLRSPNPKPDLQISASAIQDTLATMPNYEGISYRGISVANLEDALNQFGISKGADYIDPAFTSYSENLDIAKDFAKKSISNRDRIIFTTSSKSGSLMGSYAQHDFEKEILFPAGFPQRVKSVDIKREGISNVAYVELADTPESAKFLKDFGLSDKKKSIKEAIANPAIASQILRDELSVQPRNFLSTQKKNFGGEISVKDNASNFEFGQKFIAPKTGEIVSLSAINDDGSVVLRDRKNVAIEVPLKDFGKYKVKPMPNLDDLNAGDGLVKIAKAKNNFGSLVEGDRLTVQAVDGDIIRGFTDTGNYQVLSRSKIQESFRPNPLGFATYPALTSGLLGTSGIVGGATAGKLLAKSLGANEDQQNVAAGIGGAIGGLTGVTTGYIGDGVTMPKSFRDMAKRAMGVKSNSEAGMVAPISMFEPPKRKSGLLYLPNYLTIADQKDLLNDLRTVVRQSPLFTPTMSSGAPFRYKMTNIGDLGWNSDRKGYRYESKHPVTGQPYPEIPSSLRSMIDDLSGKFGEKIRPDAVLLNWYPDGAKLGLHVDSTEKVSKPVVSLSLGDRGVFAIDTTGSRDRSTATKSLERINVNSGDAIVFGGDLRNAYHAVERIDAGTAPPELGMKNSGRINLTARQVNKISGGGFGNSVSKLAKGFAMREGARLLAKQLGADEQQQQAVADTVTAANVLGSVYQNATKKSGVKSNSEAGMVAPNKVGDQILDSLNPTGGIFAGYSPEARVKAKLAKNIKTLADTMRVSPDDLITVYRGSAFQDSINDGDFVTTNKQLAKDYAGGGKVLSQTVRYGDILDDINEPLGDEYILRKGAYEQINSRSADKKINTGSVSSSVKEPKMPKLTTDTLYKYLQMMGGDPVIVKPDGSQATKGKFAFGQDIGLNNEFTKLPEIHTRFDDPKIASMVAKELATGELTVGMQRNPETGEIETVTKKFQPIPSRGNTQLRRYSLSNDPSGAYIAFNKPEEAYKAPKSLKELQADTRKAYQSFGLKPNATIAELQAAVQPIVNEVRASQDLRDRLATVLVDMKNRPELEPVPLERGWDKVQSRSPMIEQKQAIAPEPQPRLNPATDTGGWANAQGESLVTLENVDQKRKQVAAERSAYANQKAPFASQRLTEVDRYGVGAPLDDEAAYNLAKRKFETIKRSALEFPDTFQGVDQSAKFPSFSNLKRQALSEGIMLADSGTNAFKAYADAKAAELTGTLKIPESGLPVTARLGQEYISPKTGKIGTVESVGKKGVKLNVDGQVVPLEYQTLERLKYTGNKDYGFSTPAALRPANAGLFGGTLGAIAFKQLAKAAGLNEDQQNIAAGVGGVTGAITGGSLSLFKPTTELKAPTARQFAQSVMGVPAPSESGMFLSAEGRNKMRLNQLNQYDVKPVLSDAAVLATDLLTPHPYGIATVPAARMVTESWKNNYDAIAERGLKAMKTTATGATAAVKDFTYQTLSQLGRSVGLPFPMTEQAVGQVLDAIPNADQVMGMAKSRFARNSESGMVMMGDRPQTLSELQRQPDRPQTKGFSNPQSELAIGRRELDAKYPYSPPYDRTAKPESRKLVSFLTFDQSADQMSMSPLEYRAFQDRVYAEQKTVKSKQYKERQSQIAKQKFQQVQSYSDALKAWNKAGDPTIPMPRKEDFVSPIKNTFDFKQTLSEASMAARSAESRVKGFSKPQPKSAIAQATQAIKNAGEIVFDALYQPSAANPSRASLPKQSTFIAESEVQKAAAATGVSEARVKAEIANQRASGESPSLGKVTEAIATRTQSKELAPRSLKELQSKELSPRVLSRQQPDGMIVAPSQKMIDAGLKDQKVKLSDRIGASGLGVFMDTAQAANVLTESVRRGENAPTALTRAGVSVGAGYAATGLASFISNPYLRTAAQLGGGIAAVIGADKAIDQIVGRNEAKEQKYAKDLSKLDLQPIEDKEQWKPFANDSNIAAAYGNSLTAQIQQNLDYRPAARSLANLANRDAIENARYQSERQTSLQTGMDAKSGKKTIAFEKRDDGTEVGYLRNRGYNATESRVLALQNLANESGYETPRTGKFDAKTLDALEKLGYSQSQISAYIKGKTKAIGKPNQVTPDKVNAVKIALARSRGEQVSSSQLSAALSAERKAQGLKGGEMLNQGQVDRVFSSLAGRSLSDLRRSQSPIKSKPLQRFGSAVGIGK